MLDDLPKQGTTIRLSKKMHDAEWGCWDGPLEKKNEMQKFIVFLLSKFFSIYENHTLFTTFENETLSIF